MNIASRGTSGEWKNNTFIHKMPMACSSLKNVLGNAWPLFTQGFGVKNDCPVPPV